MSRELLPNFQFYRAHQTHYEQIGKSCGYIKLQNGSQSWLLDSVATFRDHSYGTISAFGYMYFVSFLKIGSSDTFFSSFKGTRDWKLMHREAIIYDDVSFNHQNVKPHIRGLVIG